MQFNVHHGPANTALQIELADDECIVAEAGSMICMSPSLQLNTTTHQKNQGGILKSLKRVLGGESFFLNHYRASGIPGELWLSTVLPGGITVQTLNGETVVVQSGSFLACDENVTIDVGWQGFKSMFSGESLFWLKASGQGELALSSFGSIYEVTVEKDYIIDTGHIVAFEETLDFSISKAGSSWLHSFLGGEGLICHFKGEGKVWCQSHHEASFGQQLTPHLKVRQL